MYMCIHNSKQEHTLRLSSLLNVVVSTDVYLSAASNLYLIRASLILPLSKKEAILESISHIVQYAVTVMNASLLTQSMCYIDIMETILIVLILEVHLDD